MTQSSRPNSDHIANYPTSDAGPYSRDQWAECRQTEYTGDQYTTQGPFIRVLNELEVTNPAGVTIRVDTGAGICTGTDLFNSATVDFTPTTPLVGNRIDKVVMCLNNTNATYNTNLEFPTVLADYDGTASIEPYSCRLAILTGVDGGAARALVQTANYYMVELARYTITMAPAISNLDDRRVWSVTPCASVQRISEYLVTSVTGAVATITFSSIPGNYRHLRIEAQGRSDYADIADIVRMRFNGDTGANYRYAYDGGTASGVTGGGGAVGATYIYAAAIVAATGDANYGDAFTHVVSNYAGTTFYKSSLGQWQSTNAGGLANITSMNVAGWWANTNTITQIEFSLDGGGNFMVGSIISLYGLT